MTTKPTKIDRRTRAARAPKPPPPTIGRPSAIRGKGATIGIRLTETLRAQLVRHAADQQLSLSDAVALLLQRALSSVR